MIVRHYIKVWGVTTWKYSSNYKWIYHHRYGGHIAISDGVQPSLYPFCSPQLHSEGVTHLQMTYLYYSCIYRSWKCQFPIWSFPQMGVALNHPAGVPPLWKAPRRSDRSATIPPGGSGGPYSRWDTTIQLLILGNLHIFINFPKALYRRPPSTSLQTFASSWRKFIKSHEDFTRKNLKFTSRNLKLGV